MSSNISFMDIIPDIRGQIYNLLLLNPDLGHRSSCMGGQINFGLSSNILLVNKSINKEASKVLYEHNCFYLVYFQHRSDRTPYDPNSGLRYEGPNDDDTELFGNMIATRYVSPILRYRQYNTFSLPSSDETIGSNTHNEVCHHIQDIKALSHIRNWNIVLTISGDGVPLSAKPHHKDRVFAFQQLCQALAGAEIKTLNVLLFVLNPRCHASFVGRFVPEMLEPLRLLRVARDAEIRLATKEEIPAQKWPEKQLSRYGTYLEGHAAVLTDMVEWMKRGEKRHDLDQ
ncbi:hypothetical protein BJ875DRAFT_456052 [Amylocarpus encephaloides]|uniref:Uncharacterized protein n=1 Tax=Amylocarpus encephaloides TaxID=45428 RepID=A0A9P7YMM5_9HELO|nr:hypothetical protein BJ875DRAFT_456052 [Amylocarpus encephaloides]